MSVSCSIIEKAGGLHVPVIFPEQNLFNLKKCILRS